MRKFKLTELRKSEDEAALEWTLEIDADGDVLLKAGLETDEEWVVVAYICSRTGQLVLQPYVPDRFGLALGVYHKLTVQASFCCYEQKQELKDASCRKSVETR